MEGGVTKVSRELFCFLKILVRILLEVNIWDWEEDDAIKDTYFFIISHFKAYKYKNSYFRKWKCHKGGGGQKSAKKVSRIIWMVPYDIPLWDEVGEKNGPKSSN